jgi:hypothetical protein
MLTNEHMKVSGCFFLADKFIEDFTNTFDKASLNYENVLVLGDLNYNMQDGEKSSPLQSVCDIFDYSNLVKKETWQLSAYRLYLLIRGLL